MGSRGAGTGRRPEPERDEDHLLTPSRPEGVFRWGERESISGEEERPEDSPQEEEARE